MEGPYPIILGLALAASAGCETSKTSPFEPGDIVVFTGIIFGERHDTTPVRCVGHWDRGCDVTTGTRARALWVNPKSAPSAGHNVYVTLIDGEWVGLSVETWDSYLGKSK